MSISRWHITLGIAWLVVLATAVGIRANIGTPFTTGEALAWLALSTLPPVVMLRVFRGAPPASIGGILYEAEQRGDRDRTGNR